MNVGIFTDAYYPQINGVVISTQTLKNELEKLGHIVTIVTVKDPNAMKSQPNVYRLPSLPFAVLPDFRVGSVYSTKIMREIKKLNLDILHTQTEFSIGIFARIVAKSLKIPVVHTYHTMYEEYTHYFSTKHTEKYAKIFTKKVSRFICDSADGIVVPTDKVKFALQDYGIKSNTNVVPTGVDLEQFNSKHYSSEKIESIQKEVGIENGDLVILFVGRLAKEKSIDVLIRNMPIILESIPSSKLLIIGDGPEKNSLEMLSKELNCHESVIFAGKKAWEDIGRYYQIGNIFVSASTSETQGLTFIEAMASKVPVIAKYDTNLDGVIEDGVNGQFFHEDCELGTMIVNLLGNSLLRTKLSDNAFEFIKTHSSGCFGKSIESVYIKTISDYFLSKFEVLSMKLC